MHTVSKRILLLGVLAVTAPSFAASADTSKVTELLESWRNHILTMGNMAGVELDSDDYRALVAKGPNILPEVFQVYENEQDRHVLYYYAILIQRVAHFDAYLYSDEPVSVRWRDLKDDKPDKPILSTRIAPGGLFADDWAQYATGERDKLTRWWKLRKTFLGRTKSQITTITGKTKDDFKKFDKYKARALEKYVRCYGIYNIPLYIEMIGEHNDPISFTEFLRVGNSPLWQELVFTGNPMENMEIVSAKFPAREDKIRIVQEWWASSENTYAGLEELHKAIAKAVKQLTDQEH